MMAFPTTVFFLKMSYKPNKKADINDRVTHMIHLIWTRKGSNYSDKTALYVKMTLDVIIDAILS